MGKIVATHAAIGCFGIGFITDCLKRHASGDWGDVSSETRRENDRADETQSSIFSVYKTESGTLWIITEWDRSATTALLPEEY